MRDITFSVWEALTFHRCSKCACLDPGVRVNRPLDDPEALRLCVARFPNLTSAGGDKMLKIGEAEGQGDGANIWCDVRGVGGGANVWCDVRGVGGPEWCRARVRVDGGRGQCAEQSVSLTANSPLTSVSGRAVGGVFRPECR